MLSEPVKKFILAELLICLAVAAYLPIRDCAYIWDDDYYVTENKTLRSLDGLKAIWFVRGAVPQYYPVVHTTFWIEYQLWELKPLGYHLVNLALHIMVSLLWWVVLKKMNVPGAWLAAAIFAVHPVHVESVAWVTERKNVLSGVFYLLSLITYIKFCKVDEPKDPLRMRDWRLFGLSLFCFALALLSKSVTATLPCVILLGLWWKQKQFPTREMLVQIPFFLVGALAGIHTALMERDHVGAEGAEWAFSHADRLLIAGRAFWFYAYKLIWPEELMFFYERWHIDDTQLAQYVFPLSAIGVMITLWAARKRIGYGPITAVLFFAGSLFPALGFLNVFPFRYSFVADHFQYLASMGIIALTVSLVAVAFQKFKPAFIVIGVIALSLLIIKTRHQIPIYQNEVTLWEDLIERNPAPWMAHNNLGNYHLRHKDYDKAIEQFTRGLAHRPGYDVMYYNLGTVHARINKHQKAIWYYERALQLNPDDAKCRYNYSVSLMKLDRYEDAREQLEFVVKALPNHAKGHFNLGKVLLDADVQSAMEHFKSAAKLDPKDPDAWLAIGLCHERMNNYAQAEEVYLRGLSLPSVDSSELHTKLALARIRLGKFSQAFADLQQAVEVNPKNAEAQANLGTMFLQQGDTQRAVEAFTRAIEVEPNRRATLRSLAWTLATTPDANVRDGRKAVEYAQRSLAQQDEPDALILDVLAASYAEAGAFEEAVETATKAEALANEAGKSKLAEQIAARLELYKNEKPYRSGQATDQ